MSRLLVDFLKATPDAELTGSRFFGNAGPNSDWDFFVGPDWKPEHYLLISNVVTIRQIHRKVSNVVIGNDYLDSITKTVYLIDEYISYNTSIHVQVVKDLYLKRAARNFLDALPPTIREAFLSAPKKARKVWWDFAIQSVKG
jgi:hypothetical protein